MSALGGVLVTGATTPIGVKLCARLLALGAPHVLACGQEREEDSGLPRDGRVVYQRADLTRAREAHELLFGPVREHGISTIVHLSMHRSPMEQGRRAYALNVEALRTILELAERHPTVKRLVVRSWAEVYKVDARLPTLVTEDHPLNLARGIPQWIRDRVEADLTACARMGMSKVEIAVLRLAEVLAPECGSQLWDFLNARVCLVPAGYDPMLNFLTVDDAVEALVAAVRAKGVLGIFNVAGKDTLPLTEAVRRFGKVPVPVPGPLLSPIYRARRRLISGDFSYGMNERRLHYATVLDGTRAKEQLGFEARHHVNWPASGNRFTRPRP